MHACEAALADHLEKVLDRGEVPDLEGARGAVARRRQTHRRSASERLTSAATTSRSGALSDEKVDAAELPLMLTTLRLPTLGWLWHSFAEGWTAKARALDAIWPPA